MRSFTLFTLLFLGCLVHAKPGDTLTIGRQLYLVELTPQIYVHVSYMNNGTTPCNGMILHKNGKALLFDTPFNDSITNVLLNYLTTHLKLTVVAYYTGDWHPDSMGGINEIHRRKIPSYGNELTEHLAKSKNMTAPLNSYSDTVQFKFQGITVLCWYPGPAHTLDNVVTWIPEQEVLFAGCILKEKTAPDIGYVKDGDIKAYPESLRRLMERFPNPKYIIPGHGAIGGPELYQINMKFVTVH